MNQDVFAKLLSSICSLESSTRCEISYRGILATLDGRCSPYVSHQTVEFSRIPDSGQALLFENSKYRLAVGGGSFSICPCKCEEEIGGNLPSGLVRPLLEVYNQYIGVDPGWDGPLIQVRTTRKALVGWGDGGKPVYAEHNPSEEEEEEYERVM